MSESYWYTDEVDEIIDRAIYLWKNRHSQSGPSPDSVRQAIYMSLDWFDGPDIRWDDAVENLLRRGVEGGRCKKLLMEAEPILRFLGEQAAPSYLEPNMDSGIEVPARATWDADDIMMAMQEEGLLEMVEA
jgi:hypothetical protein